MNQGDALQTIAEIAITLGGFTGLVAAFSGWTESVQLIWGIPSLLYGLTILALLYTTVHRWMTGTFTPTYRHFVAVNIAIGIAIHLLIVLSAFNFVLDASASMMIVGMIWSFTHGATIFLAMLSILWEES